jgi:tRNA (guanine-N7-)-methyltransferase
MSKSTSPVSPDIPRLELELGELVKPLDLAALFGRQAPAELEIGIGSGYFLSRYALDHPELNLLGLDNAGSEVRRTADKCQRLGASNVRVLRVDALYFLEEFPTPGAFQTIHIYYSDPWPKTRHHRRRLWQPRLVPLIERALAPDGILLLKTDVTSYFEVIQQVLGESKLLRCEDTRRIDLEPMSGDYDSNFQRKAVEQGHPLHWQRWRRAGE